MKYSAYRSGRALGLPKWQLVVLLVVALSIGLAVAIVATGVFLIALPAVALVVLGYRLFGGARRRPRPTSGVIEGEYEVVDDARGDSRSGPRR